MYQMAKTAREKLKAKARSLASEKDSKVDSSDWSPAEPLNADVKTGMRPISPRAYKGGGKVDGKEAKPRSDRKARKAGGRVETEIGVGMANKNMKEANKSRPGVKHVGGFKKGGDVKDAGVKDKKALGAIDPSPKRGATPKPYKKGGEIGRAMGGKDPSYVGASSVTEDNRPVMRPKDIEDRRPREPQARDLYEPDQMKRLERGYKKGGKTKKADGGSLPSPEEAIGSEVRMKGLKVMPGKSATAAAQVTPAQLRREEGYTAADMKAPRAGRKDGGGKWIQKAIEKPGALRKALKVKEGEKIPAGKLEAAAGKGGKLGKRARLAQTLGRLNRATGGATLMSALKGATKKAVKKGGKTDINIVINAGKTPMPRPEGVEKPMINRAAPPMPPAGMGMAPPSAPAPMDMPPMGGIGSPPPAPIIGRKAGGRITKVASSYKDMEAGAASGEGRLQKTDIAKKHRDAPARKEGGRISKVAKSYKDMTAGSGSGEGRLQKEDIAKAKKARAA